MMGRYTLEAVDDGFFDTAAARGIHTTTIPASPQRVWRALAADDAVRAWSPAVTGGGWQAGTPCGIGAERTVTILGALTIEEKFYRWDESRRMTFGASAINRPLCRAFGEDYILEEVAGGTRFTWRAAMDPNGPPVTHRPLGGVLSASLAHMTRGLVRRIGDTAATGL